MIDAADVRERVIEALRKCGWDLAKSGEGSVRMRDEYLRFSVRDGVARVWICQHGAEPVYVGTVDVVNACGGDK